MKRLKTEKQIKQYIHQVINRGNGKEIEATLKRYYAWKRNREAEKQISMAKEVFGIEK